MKSGKECSIEMEGIDISALCANKLCEMRGTCIRGHKVIQPQSPSCALMYWKKP